MNIIINGLISMQRSLIIINLKELMMKKYLITEEEVQAVKKCLRERRNILANKLLDELVEYKEDPDKVFTI